MKPMIITATILITIAILVACAPRKGYHDNIDNYVAKYDAPTHVIWKDLNYAKYGKWVFGEKSVEVYDYGDRYTIEEN